MSSVMPWVFLVVSWATGGTVVMTYHKCLGKHASCNTVFVIPKRYRKKGRLERLANGSNHASHTEELQVETAEF